MKMKKTTLAIALVTSLGAGFAISATDGDLGATSSGDFDINFAKAEFARVWGLSDIAVTDADGANIGKNNAATDDICVFANKGLVSNLYELEISSDNKFQLLPSGGGGGPVTPVNYNIEVGGIGIASSSETLDNESVNHGVDSSVATGEGGFMTAGNLLQQPNPLNDCTGENAQVRVWLNQDEVVNVAAGDYTDTVTLTVAAR